MRLLFRPSSKNRVTSVTGVTPFTNSLNINNFINVTRSTDQHYTTCNVAEPCNVICAAAPLLAEKVHAVKRWINDPMLGRGVV